jgi:UDP-N-acetylmuramoyl-tripeptide--D-alanyl-D-alanine ligase
MEKIKNLVVRLLNYATVRYLRRSNVKIIAVAGSIGKTSTVSAIRVVLGQHYKVHQPKTAYNTNRSVHLEVFNYNFATSVGGWLWVTARMLVKSLGKAPYDILVTEIGTDHPGEMQSYAFLRPHIGVLTAIAPEHMEYFKTIEAVAKEEFVIAEYCDVLVANRDAVARELVPEDISSMVKDVHWYGHGQPYSAYDYSIQGIKVRASFNFDTYHLDAVPLHVLGEHSLGALTAAGAVSLLCGLSAEEIGRGLQAFQPVKGRMQLLAGTHDSVIIDDSYNASPNAARAALDVLYAFDAPQRIALLGTMNEMGDYSERAHSEVGQYCDPAKLDLVVTIGKDANDFLASAAKKRGCEVKTFTSPYEAGTYLSQYLKPHAVVLVKGSQNGVYAEEAIKPLLADAHEVAKLVRQSEYWMDLKRKQFGTG